MRNEGERRVPPPFGPTHLARALADRIADSGPITFAEFMQQALYSPDGYYRGGGRIAASGDYFTAPSAHPAFGALIAIQLHDLWIAYDRPSTFNVVEMGAGDGLLSRDVTKYSFDALPEFAEALAYHAFDEVPETAEHFDVRPMADLPRSIQGCVLSNELLDALPVHRFVISGGGVREIFVGAKDGELVEVVDEPSTPAITQRISPYLDRLMDGYRGEVNLGVAEWAGQVSETLRSGHVFTIDYGFNRPELYAVDRASGSLRCYYRHTLGQDPLVRVGLQDITSHVDFTAVDEELDAHGFASNGRISQADFLSNLGIEKWVEELQALDIGELKKRSNMAGLLQITNPTGMGGFVVDVHSRGIEGVPVSGLGDAPPGGTGPLPLLSDYPGHIDVTGGTPSASQWFEVPSFEHLFSDEP